MKSTYLLCALLACSLAFNFYQARTSEQNVSSCTVTQTFAPAIEISNDVARLKYIEFTNSLVSPDSITGGVIARAAFDSLFCMNKCNGITYSFARDASQTIGPPNRGIFLIIEGVNITFDPEGRMVVNPIPGSKKYRSGSWCPPSCMNW